MPAFIRPTTHFLKQARSFSVSAARSDLNKIQLIGRIGADPITNETGENRRVTNYTVATSETRPDKEGNLIKRTQWHRVAYWQPAEWFSKVKKGDQVYVEGTLRYNDYTDKEGVSRTKAEINQTSFKLLNPSRNSQEDDE
ncbi:uncharacterized protein B0P05DRAFT_641273 [Gilbertella persicaria]|uniref:SsDNA-binding protein, mitochondrial n=1 Tax=Rhizopus stolonifer TaxID=4846 RepID=A0A367KV32_RHIST|nr:uncharacterized protein B0P05DRAFT_641273 [Gilbertella persicaria]KAI8054929.1 hypothetical protein B0P05DRAFT_641273 [Gilbertella persicaria]RCI05970.1 hypothetical protein CU098_011004 [Rhizopus stolonifer]